VRRRAQCSQHVLTLRNKVLLVDLDAEFLEAGHYKMPKPHLGMVEQVFLRTKPHIANGDFLDPTYDFPELALWRSDAGYSTATIRPAGHGTQFIARLTDDLPSAP
jgi:hypothetical protein